MHGVAAVLALEASLISNLPIHRKLTDGINFFFAALPDEPARGEIAEMGERFRKSHRLSGTAVGVDNLHLLLCPMGRPDRLRLPLEGALAAAAAAVQANAFELTLDSVMRLMGSNSGPSPMQKLRNRPSRRMTP